MIRIMTEQIRNLWTLKQLRNFLLDYVYGLSFF